MTDSDEEFVCPLCMEEIDITDKYFKPCPCGYQICRFCWNHIKENLNSLCPACRRPYSDDTVDFKPVPSEELARIKTARRRKEKEKKEQEVNARKQLANVRVIQKNLVYVLGLPPKVCSDEILKQSDYFGQYGKILKIVINRRPITNAQGQTVIGGVYITYVKKDDAAKAIEAVDGSVLDGRVIRATYGTTKYCSYYLRNQPCQNTLCQYLHEPGEEVDNAKPILRQATTKPQVFPLGKKEDKEESALPPTVSWAKPPRVGSSPSLPSVGDGHNASEHRDHNMDSIVPDDSNQDRFPIIAVDDFKVDPEWSLEEHGFKLKVVYSGPFDPFREFTIAHQSENKPRFDKLFGSNEDARATPSLSQTPQPIQPSIGGLSNPNRALEGRFPPPFLPNPPMSGAGMSNIPAASSVNPLASLMGMGGYGMQQQQQQQQPLQPQAQDPNDDLVSALLGRNVAQVNTALKDPRRGLNVQNQFGSNMSQYVPFAPQRGFNPRDQQ